MCPSMIRKFKVVVYFRKVFLLPKFKSFCFVAILDISLMLRACKNDHIILHFTFLFSLFVFVSAAGHYFRIWTGHYFSIWTGQVPALLF